MKLYCLSFDNQTDCAKTLLYLLKTPQLNEEFTLPQIEVLETSIHSSHELVSLSQKACPEHRPVFLGRDVRISSDLIRGFAKTHQQSGLVLLCARVPPYLKDLVEQGVISPERILLIGLRGYTSEEIALLRHQGIRSIGLNTFIEEGIAEVAFSVMEALRGWKSVYLSLNLNVVDPVFVPGVDHPEVGGFTSRELLFLLQKLKLVNTIKAFDLVGINPEKDRDGLTAHLGAKLLLALS